MSGATGQHVGDYGTLLAQALAWAVDDARRYLARSGLRRLTPTGQVEADRRLLDALLTLREPGPVPPQAADAIGALLAAETRDRGVVDVATLPRVASSGPLSAVALWQGDITRLRAGAVVNAANSALLGCRVPGHACIDNAIHAAAGPWLRNACAEHVGAQGAPEPTGTAVLTPGFSLPAQAVVHTVGPVVSGGEPTEEDARLLASCYRSCLEATWSAGLGSIALCSVSTGAFGYPVELAARVALREILDWLGEHEDGGEAAEAGGHAVGGGQGMLVVIDTFSQHDTQVYQVLLEEHQGR
ncbi:macro domain-containing protein [Actinomyces wuliandei]|uniref:macro domain-containing protein n=1 Tax=Actinomyces wuliandei TaxID=2057743 RepID=UPI001119DA8C|nr:macro domain-containing protein [Actinomyces wuliandei]